MDPNLFNWFLIFNRLEFEALNLVSKSYTVNLVGIGEKTILVTKGNLLSMTYEGVMVGIGDIAEPPFVSPFLFEGVGMAQMPNGNVYLGVLK